MNLKSFVFFLALIFSSALSSSLIGQGTAPDNWFNLDAGEAGVQGVSSEKLYNGLLKNKKGETVIVAIIDSGVDAEHEDLKDIMWVNPGEIAGNGIDDDKNGYVDDIHGWNFIGGKNGNIDKDNLEVTRLYRKYHKQFKDVTPTSLSAKDKVLYAKYKKMETTVEDNRQGAAEQLVQMESTKLIIMDALDEVAKVLDGKAPSVDNIKALAPGDNRSLSVGKNILSDVLSQGEEFETIDAIKEYYNSEIQGALDYYDTQANYQYNPDFDPRQSIVGDNYADQTEKSYGNNDVEGPDAFHGTHVAGIVAAVRHNETGMNGVANNVQIMSVRAVPDGDERDKDVANAIRYAVDNGASIINMSFGKGFSWNKKIVDDAVRYAEKKDVLLVHAAGNSHENTDIAHNFPNDKYEKKKLFGKKEARNWIEVGALSWKGGEDAAATFSNYGKTNVDLFAPGVAIYSTTPDNNYGDAQGTSMASPVVAGVAAIIRSYFPKLSARQVKSILMESVVPLKQKVNTPGAAGTMVPFSQLSVSGGVINALKAAEKAAKTKGKRKAKLAAKQAAKTKGRMNKGAKDKA